MDKATLVVQLVDHLRASAHAARLARDAAATEARDGATPAEKREDARAAIEHGAMARAQDRRLREAEAAAEELAGCRPPDTGEGRTFFLAPTGAGVPLTGPGGDGFLSVVTPQSPIGRAVMGRREGDTVDVMIDGRERSWTIAWVG